jgi:hypothetical protein
MMAKKPTRQPARPRPRPYRAPNAGPAPLADSPDVEQQDWNQAEQAASEADEALAQAEGYFQTVAQAAEEAEAAAAWALRAAEQAEAAAVWVVADAERLLAAARARVEAARALARAGRMVATDAQEGEWEAEQADPDLVPGSSPPPGLSPTFQAANRAMTAACGSPSRRRYN